MSRKITVTVTDQVGEMLDQLASMGLWGRNPAEVARRFIDQSVVELLPKEHLGLKIPRPKTRKTRK